jgi:hypothetical protein
MLDQNLLDKQYILESLVDLLEKNTVNNLTGANNGAVLSNLANQTQQSSSSLQKTLSNANAHSQSLLNEFPTVKLILNTSNVIFYKNSIST